MKKKSSNQPINTKGTQTCLVGLGMRFDQETGQCTLGVVGKNMAGSHPSSHPKNIEVYMSDDTHMTYLHAGKKIKNS